MKKIHVLPTDKPSKLFIDNDDKKLRLFKESIISKYCKNQNIYITSDEEIKEGYVLNTFNNTVYKIVPDNSSREILANPTILPLYSINREHYFKIILTDNDLLIKDGVQAIEDEFLEWFVKNPSCENVEVVKHISDMSIYVDGIKKCIDVNLVEYEITIPKEEPEQDTLEAAEKLKSTEEENYLNLMRIEESANEYSKTVPDAYGVDDFAREGFTMGAYSESAKKYWYTIFKHEENAK